MKKWIFTAFGDAFGLEQRLNQLADAGLELVSAEDGLTFRGEFVPTSRQELRYFVEPAPLLRTKEQLLHRVEELRALGWVSRCTLNGLDVYASAPLRFPERPMPYRSRLPDLVALLGVLLSLLLCILLPGPEWYLNNTELFMRLSAVFLLPIGTLWALWRLVRLMVPARRAAPVPLVLLRGALSALWLLWWWLLAVSVVFTLLPPFWALVTLLSGLLLRLWLGIGTSPEGKPCWTHHTSLSQRFGCVGLTLLLAIGLHRLGVTAVARDYAAGAAPWGDGWAVHTSDVMREPAEISSTEYRKCGSLIVQRESYTEVSETQRLECQRCTCLIPALNGLLSERWTAQLPTSGERYTVTRGRQTLLLWCARPCDMDPEPQMRALLNR